MSGALKAGGCRAPDGRRARRAVRGSRVSSPLSAVRARSSRVVRASSRTLLARCSNAARAQFARCSNAARVVFARCSHSQFALLIFKLGWLVACEFAPAVCTLCRRAAGGRRCHAQPACFRFGVAGVSVLALRWKDAAPGRVGAIQFLHAKPLLLRAAGGHQQRAGELRGGNAAAFG